MYSLLAVLAVIIGISFLIFSTRLTKNNVAIICGKTIGIALVVVGLFMLYLVFSGKVVLPLSKTIL